MSPIWICYYAKKDPLCLLPIFAVYVLGFTDKEETDKL